MEDNKRGQKLEDRRPKPKKRKKPQSRAKNVKKKLIWKVLFLPTPDFGLLSFSTRFQLE